MSHHYQVVVVGAGAVGLFLSCRLAQLGFEVVVLERQQQPLMHTRSIGIHPPSLERFQQLGIIDELLQAGLPVARGIAFSNTEKLGELSLSSLCTPPFNFVLALPQYQTEAILERLLGRLKTATLLRGTELTALRQEDGHVKLSCHSTTQNLELTADYVVACDGKNSLVRQALAIPFQGGVYPDTYVMGDVADNTELGNTAAIYLCDAGVVESFPLPGGQRRWVVKTASYQQQISAEQLAEWIEMRLDHRIDSSSNTMLSSFGVQHYLAQHYLQGRVILAGDAAHVVSPIGGQGMNLGWLDAWTLADSFTAIREGAPTEDSLARYERKQQHIARAVMQRAAINMRLGREVRHKPWRDTLIRLMLHTPLRRVLANVFTMRWLS